jgi:hypothetical protein
MAQGTPTAAKAWQQHGRQHLQKQLKDHGRLQQQGACKSRHVLIIEDKPVITNDVSKLCFLRYWAEKNCILKNFHIIVPKFL